MTIQDIVAVTGLIIAGIGLIATGIGLLLNARQLRLSNEQMLVSQKIARGEFLLHLDEMFRHHDATYRRLRPGGEWSENDIGPKSTIEWADVDQYMGLFERIQVLVESKIINLEIIDRLYGYRISNIVSNKVIRTKLEENKPGWQDFIALASALKRY